MTQAVSAASTGRSLSVDALRLCLAVMVVFLHCNPASDISPLLSFVTGNGLYRVAVPAFFMLSGYFFFPSVQAGRAMGYVRRIGLLYGLWMLIYLPLWYGALRVEAPVRGLLLLTFGWWHLWYLASLAVCALLTLWLRKRPTRQLLGVAVVLFGVGVALMYAMLMRWLVPDGIFPGPGTWLNRNGLFLGLPFFLAGFVVRRQGWERRLPAPLLWVAALVGLALLIIEAWGIRSFAPRLLGLDTPLSMGIAAPAVVMLALQGTLPARSRLLGTLASGTFFLHVAVLVPLMKYTSLSRTAIALVTLAATCLISFLLYRTKLDRYIM
jgi:surface polysaccharide O-acyltransferase-like enzyme